jgi:hypothetical protein
MDSIKELDKETEDILFSLGEILNNKLCLKPEDAYLEDKINNLIRPFLLLDEKDFQFFTKYQTDFNEKICPYYFDFYSNNNAPWQLVNKISMGVGNTVIETGLDRTYYTMRFVIREEKDSFNSLYINKEHMKDADVYNNMKSFLESMIEQINVLIENIKNDPKVGPEIKALISNPVDFSEDALEKRAIKQEIDAIKKIIPEEIKSKQRFDSLQEQIQIKPVGTKEKIKKI